MSVLKKPYEISLWEDVLVEEIDEATNETIKSFKEKKIFIIGSNEMASQSRALSPKLVSNINGTNTFTFDLYYRYKDSATGKIVNNPFTPYITNERKLKLKYDDQWYDLIIKSVKIDTVKHSLSVTATDQYINELSKNGFNFTFDADLENNVGSPQKLAKTLLSSTDWKVPLTTDTYRYGTEFIPDLSKEALVILNWATNSNPWLNFTGKIFQIQDDDIAQKPEEVALDDDTLRTWTKEDTIFGFYSCCENKNSRFSFIRFSNAINPNEDIKKDDERVIQNIRCQYYIDGLIDSNYSLDTTYNIYIPNNFTCVGISSQFRGARYNYTPQMVYNKILQTYTTIYKDSNNAEYYGVEDFEYKAPNLIQNIVTNPNNFKSTAGWRLSRYLDASSTEKGILKTEGARLENGEWIDIIQDLENNNLADFDENGNAVYTPFLHYTSQSYWDPTVIYNTGFFDNRASINDFQNGREFIIKIKFIDLNGSLKLDTASPDLPILRIGSFQIDPANDTFDLNNGHWRNYIKINNSEEPRRIGAAGWQKDNNGYYWTRATIVNADSYTPNVFKKQSALINNNAQYSNKIYITFAAWPKGGAEFYIQDFQIFPYVKKGDGYMDPKEQLSDNATDDEKAAYAQGITTKYYKLYKKSDFTREVQDKGDLNPVYNSTIKPTEAVSPYILDVSCEKRRAVTAKESNYFNIIQTICETFECWAEFKITHNSSGLITKKRIIFHNYIGQDNFAGFRYGVNLKSIQRTDDSKAIVTKLIVKQNSNTNADHGFCTIARAPSNETGENYIYNVDYYISQGLLDPQDWLDFIYGYSVNETNYAGYYPTLKGYNENIQRNTEALLSSYSVLAQAESDLTIYENGRISAEQNLAEAEDAFLDLFGFGWKELGSKYNWSDDSEDSDKVKEEKKKIKENIGYLTKCTEFYQAYCSYSTKQKEQSKIVKKLKDAYYALEKAQEALNKAKETCNANFFGKFSRFIQEGTWISEDYYNDELYYLDAQSTLYNSCVPKVTYSFSVLEISQLPGYEGYSFKLGDRTFVEDVEYFGYDANNIPVREDVVLTEMTYNLDEPEKNNIKVQNYKNQFQDLFKRITATVQSVHFASGAYDKAAQLVSASDKKKSEFLQGALNDAGLILANLAAQTVRLDADGLTIIDGLEQNKMLRAVSKGILLTEDGGNTWRTGITADGICADILTSGTLNTGAVNIMYGKEPSFRWDAYGITAYDYTMNNGEISTIDRFTGVRFDRLGLYGFKVLKTNDGEGAFWRPNKVVEWTHNSTSYQVAKDNKTNNVYYVRNNSIFELTKEGLYLSLGEVEQKTIRNSSLQYDDLPSGIMHSSIAQFGRIDDILYNAWNPDHIPYYDPTSGNPNFIQILRIANDLNTTSENEITENVNKGTIGIFDDGTIIAKRLYVYDEIGWSPAAASPLDNIETQFVYMYKITVNPPSYTGGTTWVTKAYDNLDSPTGSWFVDSSGGDLDHLSSDQPYLYRARQTKTGKKNSSGYYIANLSEIELYKARDPSGLMTPESYAALLRFTTLKTPEGFYYQVDNAGKAHLFINATYINTGALTVADGSNNILFKADIGSKAVQIASFIVKHNKFYTSGKPTLSSTSEGVYIGSDGICIGNGFKVTANGTATIGGYATNTSVDEKVNSKSKVYRCASTSDPANSNTVYNGDIWIQTDKNNKLYVRTDSTWTLSADTRIDSSTKQAEVQILHIVQNKNANTPLKPNNADGTPASSDSDANMGKVWVTNSNTTNADKWTKGIPTPRENSAYYTCTQIRVTQNDGTQKVTTSTVRKCNSDNVILDWCKGTNSVQINGGMIAADTVYANAIKSNELISKFLVIKDNNNNIIFKADASTKEVQISAAKITGTLSASHIEANSINVGKLTGSISSSSGGWGISFNDSGSFTVGTLNVSSITGLNARISNVIADTITADYISSLGITAQKITIIDGNLTKFEAGTSKVQIADWVVTSLDGRYQGFHGQGMEASNNYDGTAYQTMICGAGFLTKWGVTQYSVLWKEIAKVSDQRLKNNICDFNEKDEIFYDSLHPVAFSYIDEPGTNFGFIAQDVIKSAKLAKIKTKSLNLLQFNGRTNEGKKLWSLNTQQLIPLNTWQIQKLKNRVADLEQYCTLLEERIIILEGKLSKI